MTRSGRAASRSILCSTRLREPDMGVVLAQARSNPAGKLCRRSILRSVQHHYSWHPTIPPFSPRTARGWTRLVRGVEGGLDLRRDASALADGSTLAAGPLANRCGRTAATRAGASAL